MSNLNKIVASLAVATAASHNLNEMPLSSMLIDVDALKLTATAPVPEKDIADNLLLTLMQADSDGVLHFRDESNRAVFPSMYDRYYKFLSKPIQNHGPDCVENLQCWNAIDDFKKRYREGVKSDKIERLRLVIKACGGELGSTGLVLMELPEDGEESMRGVNHWNAPLYASNKNFEIGKDVVFYEDIEIADRVNIKVDASLYGKETIESAPDASGNSTTMDVVRKTTYDDVMIRAARNLNIFVTEDMKRIYNFPQNYPESEFKTFLKQFFEVEDTKDLHPLNLFLRRLKLVVEAPDQLTEPDLSNIYDTFISDSGLLSVKAKFYENQGLTLTAFTKVKKDRSRDTLTFQDLKAVFDSLKEASELYDAQVADAAKVAAKAAAKAAKDAAKYGVQMTESAQVKVQRMSRSSSRMSRPRISLSALLRSLVSGCTSSAVNDVSASKTGTTSEGTHSSTSTMSPDGVAPHAIMMEQAVSAGAAASDKAVLDVVPTGKAARVLGHR